METCPFLLETTAEAKKALTKITMNTPPQVKQNLKTCACIKNVKTFWLENFGKCV